jgi:hypothetical protein
VRLNQTILTEPLLWLAPLFSNQSLLFNKSLPAEICQPPDSQIALFWDSRQDTYFDWMLAATAHSEFLWDCWELVESLLWFGRWPFPAELAEHYIERTNVFQIDNLLQSVLNVKIKAGKALSYNRHYHDPQDSYATYPRPTCLSPVALIDISSISVNYSHCSFAAHRFAHWSKQDLIASCGPLKYLLHGLIHHSN